MATTDAVPTNTPSKARMERNWNDRDLINLLYMFHISFVYRFLYSYGGRRMTVLSEYTIFDSILTHYYRRQKRDVAPHQPWFHPENFQFI